MYLSYSSFPSEITETDGAPFKLTSVLCFASADLWSSKVSLYTKFLLVIEYLSKLSYLAIVCRNLKSSPSTKIV